MYSQAAFGPPFFRRRGHYRMQMLLVLTLVLTAACTTERIGTAGQPREEIELVPPPTPEAANELPSAVCPQGVPESYGELPTELPPGVSALDDYLARQPAPDEGAGA